MMIVSPKPNQVSTETRLAHAERLLRSLPPRKLQVLRALARREGRWTHVDWDRVADGTPPPPADPVICIRCGKPWSIPGTTCRECDREMKRQAARDKDERERVKAEMDSHEGTGTIPPDSVACKDCGEELPAGRRCGRCPRCRRKRRRETQRRLMRERRRPACVPR